MLYSIAFASRSKKNYDVTDAQIPNKLTFLHFYVAALCNLGFTICGSCIEHPCCSILSSHMFCFRIKLKTWRRVFRQKLHNLFLWQGFIRRFRDPIRVPRISNRAPRIREYYHWVPKIRENSVPRIIEIGSLQIQNGFLTFSLKKTCSVVSFKSLLFSVSHRTVQGF